MKIKYYVLSAGAILSCALWVAAQDSAPSVAISSTPLFGQTQNVHPNLLILPSLELPSVGAAYRQDFSNSQTYLGYFNHMKCYDYDAANGYFAINGDANAARECNGNFSGNFMNWAAASAFDIFRLAMTGGDRVTDTPNQTVLQRALLPSSAFDGATTTSFFPVKSITAPAKVTPFQYGALHIRSCGNHIFLSDAHDPNATCLAPGKYADVVTNNVLTERRSFRVQVRVCDSKEAATRTDLCHSYDGTNYKPIGEIQRNADQVRFGALGYLNDSSPLRYGGVLRAPMKYVGKSSIDSALNQSPNPAREWNDYGVLLQNPLNDTTYPHSGIINYLNKYGRTMHSGMGTPTDNPLGAYKTYDPIGELLYEGIRYMQHHPDGPTPDAISNITPAFADNFPVYTKWSEDPILNQCQRNYALAIGDMHTAYDRYVPGNTIKTDGDNPRPTDTWSGFNVMEWTNKVGALETNIPPAGNSRPLDSSFTNLSIREIPNIPSWAGLGLTSYYMAGIAYWAHTSKFRPTMPEARVTTFAIDVDEGGNGTVGDKQRQSQIFLAAKYGGFDDKNKDSNPFRTTGPNGTTVTNDTEWEAAPTGSNVPANWFLASQPAQMVAAIKKIFADISTSSGTLSGVSLSGSQVINGGSVYTPSYDRQWNGEFTAYPLSTDTSGNLEISTLPTWQAGAVLTKRDFTTRSIYTLNSDTGNGASFAWDKLSKAQQDALSLNPDKATADALGPQRLAWLRGDRKDELNNQGQGLFRARKSVLGDIINSGSVYVGAPSSALTGPSYNTFFSDYAARKPMVYVGANDGMLHGFRADSGAEVFAYVPNAIMASLSQLPSPSYRHTSYVDAPVVASEAQVNGQWKTILTGGFGGGAQGVYALDVTDPVGKGFSASSVLWEFTDKDDVDMGNVMGSPLIAKLRTDNDSNTNQPIYKWFVIVGNGLNSNLPDGHANPENPGALFILSLDKSPGARWTLGSNYWKIVTPRTSSTMANGLSTPAMLTTGNGATTTAYAGDLQGNLWKYVLSGNSNSWHERQGGALPSQRPMFEATTDSNKRQPITMQPQVVFAPGGYMVLFGTGKYYELSDTNPNTITPSSFYGIYDGGAGLVTRSQLNKYTPTLVDGGNSISFSGNLAQPGYVLPRKPGWFFDFIDPTERQVTGAVVNGGQIYFNSIFTTASSCDAAGGSRSYALNALTGNADGRTGNLSPTGMLGAPALVITGGSTGDRGAAGGINQSEKTQLINSGASGGLTTSPPTTTTSRAGRLNWREIRHFVYPGMTN